MTRTFFVKTEDLQKSGIYSIKLKGILLKSGKETFIIGILELIDPCIDAKIIPVFVPDQQYQVSPTLIQTELIFSFSKWKDSAGGKCEPKKYSLVSSTSENYTLSYDLLLDASSNKISFKPKGLIEDSGTIECILKGILPNGENSEVKFLISVLADPVMQNLLTNIFKLPQIKNKTVKNDLFVRIKSISTDSLIKFVFSKPIMAIANFTILEER